MLKEKEKQEKQMKVISKIWSLEENWFKVFIKNEESKNKFLEENDIKYDEDLR